MAISIFFPHYLIHPKFLLQTKILNTSLAVNVSWDEFQAGYLMSKVGSLSISPPEIIKFSVNSLTYVRHVRYIKYLM